jgi:hypothetical protein
MDTMQQLRGVFPSGRSKRDAVAGIAMLLESVVAEEPVRVQEIAGSHERSHSDHPMVVT